MSVALLAALLVSQISPPWTVGKINGNGTLPYAESPAPGECVSLHTLSANDCRMVTRGGCEDCSSTNLGTAADDLALFPWGFQGTITVQSAASEPVALCFAETSSISLVAFSGVEGGYSTYDSATSSAGPIKCVWALAGQSTFFKIDRAEFGPCTGPAGSRSPAGCRVRGCTAVAAVAGEVDPVIGGGCATNAECGTGVCGSTSDTLLGVYGGVCTDASVDQVVWICRAGM